MTIDWTIRIDVYEAGPEERHLCAYEHVTLPAVGQHLALPDTVETWRVEYVLHQPPHPGSPAYIASRRGGMATVIVSRGLPPFPHQRDTGQGDA